MRSRFSTCARGGGALREILSGNKKKKASYMKTSIRRTSRQPRKNKKTFRLGGTHRKKKTILIPKDKNLTIKNKILDLGEKGKNSREEQE